VIAVTASAMTHDRAAGFDNYQAKPIEVAPFLGAVRTEIRGPVAGKPP
jgi:hypothetical protein